MPSGSLFSWLSMYSADRVHLRAEGKGGKMNHEHPNENHAIQLPRPTAWPMVMALGISLLLGGMVTSIAVGVLGARAYHRRRRRLVSPGSSRMKRTKQSPFSWKRCRSPVREPIERLHLSESRRAARSCPLKPSASPPASGAASPAALAMTVPAALFSLLKISQPLVCDEPARCRRLCQLGRRQRRVPQPVSSAGGAGRLPIHGFISLLVGLLYGAMLPMFPRYPILTAGFMAPLLFTGILYSALGIVSPILNQRIDWFWFIASQIAFGLVCGFVVNLQAKVRTPQFQALPFAVRAGLHGDLQTEALGEAPGAGIERIPPKADGSKCIFELWHSGYRQRTRACGIRLRQCTGKPGPETPQSRAPNRCSTSPPSTARTAPHATATMAATALRSRSPIPSISPSRAPTNSSASPPTAFPEHLDAAVRKKPGWHADRPADRTHRAVEWN